MPPPTAVLAQVLESLTLTLMEAQSPARWTDPTGRSTATATLIAAGMTPDSAHRCVQAIATAKPG